MKKIYLFGIIGAVLSTIIFYGCKIGSTEDGDTEVDKTTEVALPLSAPSTLKVFIDASGSMRDYFGDQNIQNVSEALSGLNQTVNSLDAEYYVWGNETNPISSDELTKRLIQKNLNGKASQFNIIFDRMVQIAGKDTLTALLSDGIISSASHSTNLSEKFTDYDIGTLTTAIQKSFKDKNKAVSIYRMKGEFNGTYWNKANVGVKYNGERPFFIFIIGDKENVRYFDSQVRKGKINSIYQEAEAVYIGSAPEISIIIEPVDGGENMASGEDFNREEGTTEYAFSGTQGFRVKAIIPKWIKESYSPDVIKRMSAIEIDGKPFSAKAMVEGDYIMFDIPQKTVDKFHDLQNPWTIKYVMKDPALKSWTGYSTSDDSTPNADQTYMLEELLNAIHKGVTGGEENILEAEITIIPQ